MWKRKQIVYEKKTKKLSFKFTFIRNFFFWVKKKVNLNKRSWVRLPASWSNLSLMSHDSWNKPGCVINTFAAICRPFGRRRKAANADNAANAARYFHKSMQKQTNGRTAAFLTYDVLICILGWIRFSLLGSKLCNFYVSIELLSSATSWYINNK